MIHPRRLSGSAGNIARYYSVGDYYSKGEGEPSEWGGLIARELGLEGQVDPQRFKELLAGSVAGQTLGRHRADGSVEHHPGWDFAVNAPKSVSIMALVGKDDRVLDLHEQAVGAALGWLEEHAAFRYRKECGITHETTGRLLFARFTEHASRELDPHLHTHVVVMNITNRADGAQMTSLETRAMFAEQMVAGQVYRNALAHGLRELGYEIDADPQRGLFEIKDVPQKLIQRMSQRAQQINQHAAEHGHAGQAARVRSFYQTRRSKEKIGLDDLHAQWRERAGKELASLTQLRQSAGYGERAVFAVEPALAIRAALFGLRHSETGEAVNNQGQIIRSGLAAHVGEVRLSDLRPYIQEHEARGKLLAGRHQSGDAILTRARTSRRTVRLELALSNHLALAIDDAPRLASSDRLLLALEGAGLTPPQEQALALLAGSRDRLLGIHGVAGSGKSTLVRVLAASLDPQTRIQAIAPTSSAAAELGENAGISSRTVASLLASGGQRLDGNDLLVLDEAGQVGNRQALRLLEISRDTGARILLLGDNKQTGAIEQGKAFWLLQTLGLPKAELTEPVRQQSSLMREAVMQARLGDYAGAIDRLDKVVTGMTADALAGDLVSQWVRLKPANRDSTNILVLDNATRLVVNDQIRQALRAEGGIAAQDSRLQVLTPARMSVEQRKMARFYSGGQTVMFSRDDHRLGVTREAEYRVVGVGREPNGRPIVRLADEQGRQIRWDPRLSRATQVNVFNSEQRDLAQGDRIQWRLATKALDLKNAERGTVEQLQGSVAAIRWDRTGEVREVDLSRFKTWDYGYAETVFSSQSKTYARVYILAPVASPLVNGQNFYTAITRARFGVKLWTEDAKRLTDKLERRSGEKSSALEALGKLNNRKSDALQARFGPQIEKARLLKAEGRRDRALDRSGYPVETGSAAAVRQAMETMARLSRALVKGQPEQADERPATKQHDPVHQPRKGLER
ncbi:MobF family relaxase [Sphingobium sp. D43FB]|uniref:MobF family relaxase n=1 Tax=Sphingobium sp. D43FB TaxID=2017595 RepID=UPI000BB540FE|nr:MobF family relaxase [Sphingobium sp. D43FB]PBN42675.1 DNA relaxase [Sphingobium sp. D43FB]